MSVSTRSPVPLSKTSISRENQRLEDEMSFWNGPFLGGHANFQVGISYNCVTVRICKSTYATEKTPHFPLYGLLNRDPYNGSVKSLHNWVVFIPYIALNNQVFLLIAHQSNESTGWRQLLCSFQGLCCFSALDPTRLVWSHIKSFKLVSLCYIYIYVYIEIVSLCAHHAFGYVRT